MRHTKVKLGKLKDNIIVPLPKDIAKQLKVKSKDAAYLVSLDGILQVSFRKPELAIPMTTGPENFQANLQAR